MKLKEITIDEAITLPKVLFVDVRSPGEFKEATIPGAINIPLLNDEERKLVGTVYKQESPAEAKKVGLEFVTPKLPQLIKEFSDLGKDCQIVVLCWRGGMRSLSISLILNLMGLPVFRLIGGYKAYRQFVLEYLLQERIPQQAIVLHGLTGVGKTEVLLELQEEGIPVLDIEGLAANRGSVFGWIGQKTPPSQKDFESRIVQQLSFFNDFKYFYVECESKRVGKLFLPPILLKGMEEGKHVLLYDNLGNRVERIVRDYTKTTDKEALLKSLRYLTGKMGKEKVQKLEGLIDEKKYKEVAEILLKDYYDPLYKYPEGPTNQFDLSINTSNVSEAVRELKDYFNSLT